MLLEYKDFKTSYVTVNLTEEEKFDTLLQFQNILCYG